MWVHCKSYSHFFSKTFQHICVSLDVNFNESLTNDIVSFEQLGPGQRFQLRHFEILLLLASAIKLSRSPRSQNLHLVHFGYPGLQSFFIRTMKTLIRLRACAGWFEFSFGADVSFPHAVAHVSLMFHDDPLTLKTPRKTASENVVCLCRLLNILADFSNLFFAYRQTVWTLIRLSLIWVHTVRRNDF